MNIKLHLILIASLLSGFVCSKLFTSNDTLFKGRFTTIYIEDSDNRFIDYGKVAVNNDHIQIRGIREYTPGLSLFSIDMDIRGLLSIIPYTLELENFSMSRSKHDLSRTKEHFEDKYFEHKDCIIRQYSNLKQLETPHHKYYLYKDLKDVISIISEDK